MKTLTLFVVVVSVFIFSCSHHQIVTVDSISQQKCPETLFDTQEKLKLLSEQPLEKQVNEIVSWANCRIDVKNVWYPDGVAYVLALPHSGCPLLKAYAEKSNFVKDVFYRALINDDNLAKKMFSLYNKFIEVAKNRAFCEYYSDEYIQKEKTFNIFGDNFSYDCKNRNFNRHEREYLIRDFNHFRFTKNSAIVNAYKEILKNHAIVKNEKVLRKVDLSSEGMLCWRHANAFLNYYFNEIENIPRSIDYKNINFSSLLERINKECLYELILAGSFEYAVKLSSYLGITSRQLLPIAVSVVEDLVIDDIRLDHNLDIIKKISSYFSLALDEIINSGKIKSFYHKRMDYLTDNTDILPKEVVIEGLKLCVYTESGFDPVSLQQYIELLEKKGLKLSDSETEPLVNAMMIKIYLVIEEHLDPYDKYRYVKTPLSQKWKSVFGSYLTDSQERFLTFDLMAFKYLSDFFGENIYSFINKNQLFESSLERQKMELYVKFIKSVDSLDYKEYIHD